MKDLWKALTHLHPAAKQFSDFEIRATSDGDEYIAVWRLAQPQPTEAELAAAIAAYDTAETARKQEATTLRNQVVSLAQSAVGVTLNNLTAAQVRALVAILLWKEGAVTPAGAIRPLAEWVRD